MGKIDISADILLDSILAGIRAASSGMERSSGKDFDAYQMHLSSRSSLVAVLSQAIKRRNDREISAAREIVESGECEMAWNTAAPAEWWDALPRCCQAGYGCHIMYGDGDASLFLCPYGRGYWQLARELLKDDQKLLRQIAKDTKRINAPVWKHWSVARGGAFK